ncbi:3009_t:CDS:2 [Funneliformis caledonium]|uniref:3009_t:CDS:1 n=1 Tax=Funneliformis caledonium TaxID=1117310 RepID=A0A9N9DKA4_9GLOM|nr:3009_t:CDS:2 [Funneliformis caledonium]
MIDFDQVQLMDRAVRESVGYFNGLHRRYNNPDYNVISRKTISSSICQH